MNIWGARVPGRTVEADTRGVQLPCAPLPPTRGRRSFSSTILPAGAPAPLRGPTEGEGSMRTKGSIVVAEVRTYNEDIRNSTADLLESLADGNGIVLGEFGTAGTTTDADEQAGLIRELAYAIRRA